MISSRNAGTTSLELGINCQSITFGINIKNVYKVQVFHINDSEVQGQSQNKYLTLTGEWDILQSMTATDLTGYS